MGQKKVIEKIKEDSIKEGEKPALKPVGGKIDIGRIYINASYNNTVLTATDKAGNVKAWISAGATGFSGPKKATPFASSKMVAAINEKLKRIGFSNIEIIVKGVGNGRDAAIKSLASAGFNILSITDATAIPHNGPQPPKRRRV